MEQDYAHCQQLAIRIMGTRRANGFGRGSYKVLNANDDPLACVCLTELLMGLVERGKRKALKMTAKPPATEKENG